MLKINIAEDYSTTPGGRYIKQGKYSGEDFRNTILMPKFLEALETNQELQIILDGVFGYAASFLEEAFGGLARMYPDKNFKVISYVSDDNPQWKEDILEYISKGIKYGQEK